MDRLTDWHWCPVRAVRIALFRRRTSGAVYALTEWEARACTADEAP
jgi:hypothetical protein